VIRLLVVDDSPLMRRLLGEIFGREADFTLAYARDGAEALAALHSFRPDVITLDVNMPHMNGLACLDRIMLERPTPVVMISALTAEGAAESVEALALGAVDVVEKPSGPVSLEMSNLGPLLVQKARAAAGARIRRSHRLSERLRALAGGPERRSGRSPRATVEPSLANLRPRAAPAAGDRLVLVGCSTGGPTALDALLAPLPPDFPWPILIAQHMPRTFTGPLARRLDGLCALQVSEVTSPIRITPGCVYIARGDADLIVSARPDGLYAMPAPASAAHHWHPSVDRLVESAMRVLPAANLTGLLMTGMGDDGAATMTQLRAAGGLTIAEAEETAVVWGMPGELVKAGGASVIAPLDALADRLIEAVQT
jgi:two-component system chemotaxis response regulator CheB